MGGFFVARDRHTSDQEDRPTAKGHKVNRQLAEPLPLERTWDPNEDAMRAALRVVLRLPAQPVLLEERGT
jgi:hypothetical protein